MLADQLLDPKHVAAYHVAGDTEGYRLWSDVLRGAAKFVIDRDLAGVIDDMPRRDIAAAMPFCRLPYPVCWIEVAQMDRPTFANVKLADGHFRPVRVGLLCEQADDPTRFWATIAWSYSDADTARQREHFHRPDVPPINVCPAGLFIDTSKPSRPMRSIEQIGMFTSPFDFELTVAPYWRKFIDKLDPNGLDEIIGNANNDWQGEPWFWLAALALINARNGVESTYTPAPPKLNRARQKAGKPPLADYHQLTLRARHRPAHGPQIGPADPSHMRAHTVRGHFKVRKTGIYWWRPFMRGDLGEGFAGKSYKVKL